MTSNRTKAQALKYAKSLEGKGLDFDNYAGWQCFDVVNYYWNYLFGHGLKGAGAKDIPTWNNFDGEAIVIKNVASTLAQPGDVFVYGAHWGQGWGHTGIVLSATLNSITVLEQNYLNGGMSRTEVTTKRTHQYDNPMWFIRPLYKKTVATKVKETAKKAVSKVTPTKKKKILLVAGHGNSDPGAVGNGTNERDFIRKNIVPQIAKHLRTAGHKVDLYGGNTMNQNLFADTAYGQRVGNYKDYGLYWVKRQKYDVVVEFHLDAAGATASGGHVIKNAYAADAIDKNIDKMLKNSVGTIRGITTRKDLLNCNVAYSQNINYRLIELGFITSKKDMDYIKKNLNSFNKGLAEAINGGTVGKTTSKPTAKPKAKQTVWAWKGRFTANTTIKVRKSPGLKGKVVDSGSWIYKGQWVDVVQIKKQDKYWWGKFKYPTNPSSGYFWMALTPITDKKERIKKEKNMYGKIKWK